ncbi:MAG TPA: 1,4-alpha-glucan branching protein GlgB [Herpetosiphonaceae bacterium]
MSETFRAPELGWDELDALLNGRHSAPFAVLGPHLVDASAMVVRTLQPRTLRVTALGADGQPYPLERVHNSDLFEGILPICAGPNYRLQIVETDTTYEIDDPYRFPLQLSDFDLHLIGEGTHYNTYLKLGAHLTTIDGVAGVEFAVWAPNAQRVSVLGDWNWWDGRVHPMQPRDSGIWELFIPGLTEGTAYKYEIRTHSGQLLEKADPYGFWAEFRPKTASVVWSVNKHEWQDDEWMRQREQRQSLEAPIAIYECHLGSWQRVIEDGNRYLSYRELAERLIPYVKRLGYTHIELLPISEHPFDGSWGYQTVGYYAPTSRHGTPDDFQLFVDQCHQAGLGVILDWVPAHFPKDAHGLITFDGTHLYEHADPRQGEHPDWGTLIFNYGRNEVRNFLLSNALFWLDKYHIDGFRVDAVSSMLYLDYGRQPGEWVANQYGGRENLEAIEFLKQFNLLVNSTYPGVMTIAEESTAWPMVSRPVYSGGLGFSLKWNMGWMHDMLDFMKTDPLYRSHHYNQLTFSLMYAFSENFVLSLSHDEVVHLKRSLLTKMPGDDWQRFANVRALFGYMLAHPGKKLLFMGMEFGQWGEWNHDTSLDWHLLEWAPHQGLQRLMADLNALYRQEPALHTIDFDWAGFEWLQVSDPGNCVIAFLRRGVMPGDEIVVACNWTPVVHEDYWVRVPRSGVYRELLNTDAAIYSGGNIDNPGNIAAHSAEDGQYYLRLRLPPLAVLLLKQVDREE